MSGYTTDDLVGRVLQRLGAVGLGQAQEPETRAIVVDALPGILDELGTLGIYDFAVSDTVPGPAMDPLSAIVASRLSDDFALQADQVSVLEQRATGAGERLLRMKFQGFGKRRAPAEFF